MGDGERLPPRAGVLSPPASGALARGVTLPPAGWAAFTSDGTLVSLSALEGTNRFDYLRSPDYVYVDGRGKTHDAPEAACDGALVIRPAGHGQLDVIHVSGEGDFLIRRPFKIRGACVDCQASDVEGKPLSAPHWQETKNETRITPMAKAVHYRLTFK